MRISSPDGQRSQDIEATVDTGTAYTTLPGRLPRELAVGAVGKRRCLLADGRRIEMGYREARAKVDGDSVTTVAVFGEDDVPDLLGAYTLESLAMDPVEQQLVSTHLIMY